MPSSIGSKVFNFATGATGDCKTHTSDLSIEKLGDFGFGSGRIQKCMVDVLGNIGMHESSSLRLTDYI